MARKGKGFDIKGLFVNHGEKMALAVILGLAVMGLAGTNWVPYSRQPQEFLDAVEKTKDNIAKTTWSPEDRAKFELQEDALPRRIVDKGIHERLQVTPDYLQSQPLFKNKDASDEPLQEPELLAVTDMEVSSERVLIRQMPKIEEEAETERETNPDGTPKEPGTTETPDDVPDELRDPTGGAGGFAGRGNPGAAFGGAGMGFNPGMMGGMGLGGDPDRDYGSMSAPELGRRGRGTAGRGRGANLGRNGGADGRISTNTDTLRGGRGTAANRGNRRGPTAAFGRGRERQEEGDEEIIAGPGVLSPAGFGGMEVEGKGYPFASVRGVFEFREQIRRYSDAIHKGRAEALQRFMIIDFKLQRQRLIAAPDQWTEWEQVNDQVFRDILKTADGFAPEVVQAQVTDSAITCPLPARLAGAYKDAASHKRLEKYKLSDEEMQREVEYNRILLDNVLKQNKLPTGVIQKRGFNDMVFDARTIQQGMFGGSSPYGGGMGGGNLMGMGMVDDDGTPMGGGGNRPMMSGGMGGRGLASNPQMAKTIAQIAKELADATKDSKSAEATKELEEFIKLRAVPEGDLLLFRYFDFDVEPGEIYRYRVALVLQNPNFGAPLAATGGVASVREGEERVTPWSEPTPAVRVAEMVQYYVAGVQPPKTQAFPTVRMNMFQYDQGVGTVVQHEVDVPFGQNVGGKARAEQANPGKGTFEEVEYTFRSEDILVDAIADLRLAKADHPDLQLPADSRGLSQMPEFATVVTPHGRIETVDGVTQAGGLAAAKKFMKQQDDYYEHLRTSTAAADDKYGYNSDDGEMVGMAGLFGGGNAERNPLRKGRGGRGGRRGRGGGFGGGGE